MQDLADEFFEKGTPHLELDTDVKNPPEGFTSYGLTVMAKTFNTGNSIESTVRKNSSRAGKHTKYSATHP